MEPATAGERLVGVSSVGRYLDVRASGDGRMDEEVEGFEAQWTGNLLVTA